MLLLWCFFVFSYLLSSLLCFFFFNDTTTTEIYTLSLHDALPIFLRRHLSHRPRLRDHHREEGRSEEHTSDSSHEWISYAVFCLKKKKKKKFTIITKKKNKAKIKKKYLQIKN